jgi:RimJ/RimL family protein N-acetyltransferase
MAEREYFLRSERLGFGVWRESDMELAWELFGDDEITRFVGGPFSQEQVAGRLRSEIASQESITAQYWPLFTLADGKFVGCCGLKSRPEAGCYEIGFYIVSSAHGNGYAKEAARAVISHAFGKMGARALYAGHNPKNEASRLLLGKLGFVQIGEEFYPPTGLMHPLYRLDRK